MKAGVLIVVLLVAAGRASAGGAGVRAGESPRPAGFALSGSRFHGGPGDPAHGGFLNNAPHAGGFAPSSGRFTPRSMLTLPSGAVGGHSIPRFPDDKDRRFRGRPRRDFHRPSVIIIDLPRARETVIVEQFDPGMTFRPPPFLPPAPPERTRLSGELAPFDPVPLEIVERMLALARVRKGDVLYDLGCGDGRVAIAAVKRFGARAVCFETDPGLVKLARENVRREKIEKAVEIREQDFTSADLSRATVVTLYLSREANDALKPLLMKRLRPGSRVVSYRFDMGDWLPKITETYRDSSGETRTLFLWEIGAPLAKNAAD